MSRGRQVPQADSSAARGDDTGCTILHVDMDAFYASVELIDHPELVGTPVIVGGGTNRGVVLSATYEARALGVRSAMPVTQAHRICPQATILTPHMSRYSQVSKAVMEIFKSFTPYVEPLSLDEAFLDVSGALRRVGSAAHIGDLIRARVQSEQGITCSVGVATSKFVAKLATNAAKPDGLFVVPADQVLEFLHPLPVGALWGVGAKTEEQLKRLGLNTVREVAHTPEKTLQRALGKATGEHLYALAWGKDDRSVVADAGERSIGAEHTFEQDVDDPAILHREILRLATRVAARLRKQGLVGRTVSIKVRFADFTTITRSKTLNEPTDLSREISQAAQALYEALGLQRARLRLVGVRIEGLAPVAGHSRQLILDAPDQGWPEAERAIDAAVARFGPDVVKPATLIDPDATN
ncbi:MAG: DNA polymerase IV [Actinobacteria bacterium]|uniref:DNA-directed DNA polymerase n=1 Tax=freshwater metagenome TaxID=449393 RepID=A0A6J6VXQ1_9ZZZZ|nr:DNA polymerase IV [Actinomycetota bacterium]